jgi:class 3 adenylate cyclase
MHLERTEPFRISPERFWPLLANTDSMNREVRLPEVAYEFKPLRQGGSTVIARARQGPIKLEWEEHPYEWTWPGTFGVRRVFSKGPFKELRVGFSVKPNAPGSAITVTFDVEPAGLMGKMLTGTVGNKTLDDIFGAYRGYERYLLGEAPTPFPHRYGRAVVDGTQLGAALKRLEELSVDRKLIERLGRLVAEEVDERVRDIRPFVLADEWNLPRLDVLRLFLFATKAGLLELRWHLVCPICRGSKGEHDSMKKIKHQHECNSCNVQFQVELERAVEARFTPAKAIRTITAARWCMGGPMNTPHVMVQQVLEPGESRTVVVSFPAGRYAIRRAGDHPPRALDVGKGAGDAEIVFGDGGPPVEVAAGAHLVLKNTESVPLRVSVEKPYDDSGASAAIITSIQEFRDLFATEALAPGQELSIGTLTLMFSDLKGSTRMYDQIGDAPAYAVVRKHFEFMTGKIRRFNGAVVKTMGDAVMAVFRNSTDAVNCALAIQKEWDDKRVGIKIGIHTGPCIAVTSTDYLDYFGSTVNIAARTQAQSIGGDIVVSDPIFRAPGVMDAVNAMGAHESTFTATLKGFENQFTLHRIVYGTPGETMKRVPGP